MKFLLVLILILLLVWKLWPEQPVPTAEESFIAPQLQPLQQAEQIEQQYMDALEKTNERIEKDSDGG
jgi:hypothetical protein